MSKHISLLFLSLGIGIITDWQMGNNVLAQESRNRKPRFSQLDFDDTVQTRPKVTPTPENLSPIEMLLKQAEQNKNEQKDQDRPPEERGRKRRR